MIQHDVTAANKSTAIADLEAVPAQDPIPIDDIQALAIETELANGNLPTEDEFDGLLKLCNEIQWTDGLWLHCHSSAGANRKCWVEPKYPF
jgi:hypothetical protein